MTKRTHILLAFIFSLFVIAFTPFAIADESLNAVAAVVNNQIITQSELNGAVTKAKAQLAASANPNALNDAQLRKMVLQQLIDEKLQLQLAKKAGITVSNAEVSAAIAHLAQANGVTVAELKAKLAQAGMSFTAYQTMIHSQLIMHQLQQHAVSSQMSPVIQADLRKALLIYQSQMGAQSQAQYHVIDIVAPTKDQAQQIMMQLKKGANISTVAPKETTDLGWQTTSALPTLFVQQLSNMKQGDVAGPIKAPNGYHVIQLAGVQGQSTSKPTKAQLENIAQQIKFQEAVKKWLVNLRKTAYIKINE